MAQGLRSQQQVARPRRGLLLASAGSILFAFGCDPGAKAPPPLPADAGAAIDALLQRWHGPLRRQLDRMIVEVADDKAQAPRHSLSLDGVRLRQTRTEAGRRHVEILLEDSAWSCSGETETEMSTERRQALITLRDLVQAAYFVPLVDAKTYARQGPSVFAITGKDGSTWRLEIDIARQLPVRITGPCGEVRFHSFLSTGASELPVSVELGALGKCELKLIAYGVLFDAHVFAKPRARKGGTVSVPEPIKDRRGEPQRPEMMPLSERPFVVLDDPGDWATRASRIQATYATLATQGQREDGFPFLFSDKDQARIGIPFTPDEDKGSPAFTARGDQVIDRRPPQFALVLYRDSQSFAAASAAGTRTLSEHAQRTGATIAGPLRVIPHLDWHRGEPSAADLAAIKVRFELPIDKLK